MANPSSDITFTVDLDVEDTVLFEPVTALVLLDFFPVPWISSNPAPERLELTRDSESTFLEFINHHVIDSKDTPMGNV